MGVWPRYVPFRFIIFPTLHLEIAWHVVDFTCHQMAFIFVVLQELIFGKGVVQGLTEGDPIYIACAVLFFASVGGLTLFLGIKGPDNYVDKDLGRK